MTVEKASGMSMHQLNRGETEFIQPSHVAILHASFLALVGIAMAIYLVSV